MFLLARHGSCEFMDSVLTGRKLDVSLTEAGTREVQALARRLAAEPEHSIKCSPRERTRQTAALIAARTGADVETRPELDEIDLGEWSGRSFTELEQDPRWGLWNAARHLQRAPGGESVLEVQARAVKYLQELRKDFPQRRFVIVSHAEVIRCVLLYYLGLSLEAFARIEVGPAALSTVLVSDTESKVLAINERTPL